MPFIGIPENCIPKNPYTTAEPVYRLVSNNHLTHLDFLPTNVENARRNMTSNYRALTNYVAIEKDCGKYSCSLFLNKTLMVEKLKGAALAKKKPFIAQGFLKEARGVADNPGKTMHINYYLRDYINNNPYTDFVVIEEIGE